MYDMYIVFMSERFALAYKTIPFVKYAFFYMICLRARIGVSFPSLTIPTYVLMYACCFV